VRASNSAPSSWLSTMVAATIRVARGHAEAEKPAFDLKLPFLERAAGRGTQHLGLRRGFQCGGRDRTTFLVVGLLQIGGHAAHNPHEKHFGVLGRLGCFRDGLAHRPHVTPLEGMRPAAGLTDLLSADGYIASAAHPGRPDVLTAWMDAAVIDENDAIASAPDLDLFDERNGPPYSAEFIERYRAAQIARNNAITDWAETELKRVHAAGFSDRPFTVLRTLGGPADGRSDDRTDQSALPTRATPACPLRPTVQRTASPPPARLRNWLECGAFGTPRPRAEPHWRASNPPPL